MKLSGKVVIVTGGAQGIGLGCARAMSAHGATIVIADRDLAAGQAAVDDLRRLGRVADFISTDVTIETQFARTIEETVARFKRLDCLVNNAGWHPPAQTIDDATVEEFESLVRLNLTSTFIGSKLAVPRLRTTRGTLIFMSSEVALIGQGAAPAYVATKAGQIGLMRALALDLAADGVRVNAICPAGVMTPLMRQWADTQYDPAAALAMVDSWHALGRMATIDEIGEVAAWLASDESSFVTGQTICPDGGAALGYRR